MFYIKNNFASANVSRTIRFTPKLFEQLEQTCGEHAISFNMLVLQCCHYALEHLVQSQDGAE